jgi:hypothetical protein
MVNKSIDPILNFNLVCCVGGGFIALFGLVSYLLKEGFYVTEPRMCTYTSGTQFPVTLTSMASCVSLRWSFPIAIRCSSHPPARIRQLSRSARYCHPLLYAPRTGNTTCYSWNTAAQQIPQNRMAEPGHLARSWNVGHVGDYQLSGMATRARPRSGAEPYRRCLRDAN